MPIGYVLINCELGSEADVIEKIKKMDETKDVFETIGTTDIIAIVESDNLEKLRELISWNIQKIDKIRNTVTLIKK